MYSGERDSLNRKSSDERLYTKRKEGGRGLWSFKEIKDETKARATCYRATGTNLWIMAAWRNIMRMKQTLLKREPEKTMQNVVATESFEKGKVTIGYKRCAEWKVPWKKLKKILSKEQKRNKQRSLAEKLLQSEILK